MATLRGSVTVTEETSGAAIELSSNHLIQRLENYCIIICNKTTVWKKADVDLTE